MGVGRWGLREGSRRVNCNLGCREGRGLAPLWGPGMRGAGIMVLGKRSGRSGGRRRGGSKGIK